MLGDETSTVDTTCHVERREEHESEVRDEREQDPRQDRGRVRAQRRGEGERRQRYTALFRRAFELLATLFETRDIGQVMLCDVRQVDPACLQARSRDFLNARQRLQLDLAELGVVDLRRLRQCGCGRASTRMFEPSARCQSSS